MELLKVRSFIKVRANLYPKMPPKRATTTIGHKFSDDIGYSSSALEEQRQSEMVLAKN